MTDDSLEVRLQALPAQPVLFITRRVPRTEIARALAECLPKVFNHCQREGIPMSGRPFVRYAEMGGGLWTLQAGMPTTGDVQGEGEIEAGTLPAGPAATAMHVGPYESLGETHGAIEQWLSNHGHAVADAPWESYITDPGEVPDPAQWQTRIFWPVRG